MSLQWWMVRLWRFLDFCEAKRLSQISHWKAPVVVEAAAVVRDFW